MQARKTLRPGQDGTKRLVNQFGDRLLCVRYRYDLERQVRYKTAEIIVETIPWQPRPQDTPGESIVSLNIGLKEIALQTEARQAGGKWNPNSRRLELRYDKVVELGLEARIDHNSIETRRKKIRNFEKPPV